MEYQDFPDVSSDDQNQLALLNTILQMEECSNPKTPLCNSPTAANNISTDQMREMVFRIAAMQPVRIDPEEVRPPPRRRNVRISTEPQSVAARLRRERISERIRILQRMVPGGTRMDTASMLEEAIQYVKFLKRQVQALERVNGVTDWSTAHGVFFSSGGIDV